MRDVGSWRPIGWSIVACSLERGVNHEVLSNFMKVCGKEECHGFSGSLYPVRPFTRLILCGNQNTNRFKLHIVCAIAGFTALMQLLAFRFIF